MVRERLRRALVPHGPSTRRGRFNMNGRSGHRVRPLASCAVQPPSWLPHGAPTMRSRLQLARAQTRVRTRRGNAKWIRHPQPIART
jgi:hypothetical protein